MGRIADYPFIDIGHQITMQPAPAGFETTFTVDDVINGKVNLGSGPTHPCECGVEVPIPGGSVKNYAKALRDKLGGSTLIIFGVAHILDGKKSTEEVTRLKSEWHEKHKDDAPRKKEEKANA